MSLAPIVLFVYNRPQHTKMTLEALAKNDLASGSILYIYADGPKQHATNDQLSKIEETRNVIKNATGFSEVIITEAETNNGLANSIVKGVTEVVNKHGKIIVLEDDLITSKGFLKYMNDALDIYENESKVMHVSGYVYPAKLSDDTEQTFFANILSCWGWATWARAWKHYEHNPDVHISHFNTPEAIKKFNIEGHADYYHQLVLNQEGKLYTWAVKWYASWLFNDGYSLFPYKSLTKNIGFDNSGTNSKGDSQFNPRLTDYVVVEKKNIQENLYNRRAIDSFYVTAVPYLKIRVIHFLKKYVIYSKLQKLIK